VEARLASEPVWPLWSREKFLVPAANRTPVILVVTLAVATELDLNDQMLIITAMRTLKLVYAYKFLRAYEFYNIWINRPNYSTLIKRNVLCACRTADGYTLKWSVLYDNHNMCQSVGFSEVIGL
jgi:hypothetical protein